MIQLDKNRSLLLASAVFVVIVLFHLARAVLGWEAFISGFKIPVYFSYLAALILGYLSWQMYDASRK